ncbi:MAG: sigma-70 family RNA polymerase sigma factor [Planctomycetes bacterium]|nr:sigma-70 family RNA polymerase sigma factor [Planctomycetota bacterium]
MAPLQPPFEAAALRARVCELWQRTGDPALGDLAADRVPSQVAAAASEQARADWTSTSLMLAYQRTADPAVFALLYEHNRDTFLVAIQQGLRRTWLRVDPQDVLQEVFLNIYRYPHRFDGGKVDAFRNWGHRIVRNTLLRALKGQSRYARMLTIDEELQQSEDLHTRRPDRAASEAEDELALDHAYLLYLHVYLANFERLSPSERRVLTLVEVDGLPYRDVARALGVRPENLKMIVFRSRQRIYRGMARQFAQSERDGAAQARRAGGRQRAADARGGDLGAAEA